MPVRHVTGSSAPGVEALERRTLFAAAAAPVVGVGVIGDSYADEYAFYPPNRASARNFVEQLAEDRALNFGAYDAVNSRPEPRNAGFAFDWARSGATSADVIAQGQHTGLAAQAAAGEVSHALVFVGGNDLIGALAAPGPEAALRAAVPAVASNLRAVVDTLLAAAPDLKVVVATVPPVGVLPAARGAAALGAVSDAALVAADAAADAINEQVRAIDREHRRVAVADVTSLIRRATAKRRFRVGPVALDRTRPSDAPDHLFLADGVHAGTVGQGLLANTFVRVLNRAFRARVKPLTNREILDNAGLLEPPDRAALTTAVTRPPPMPAPTAAVAGVATAAGGDSIPMI